MTIAELADPEGTALGARADELAIAEGPASSNTPCSSPASTPREGGSQAASAAAQSAATREKYSAAREEHLTLAAPPTLLEG